MFKKNIFDEYERNYFDIFKRKNISLLIDVAIFINEEFDQYPDIRFSECVSAIVNKYGESLYEYIQEGSSATRNKRQIAKKVVDIFVEDAWLTYHIDPLLNEKILNISYGTRVLLQAFSNILDISTLSTTNAVTNIYSNLVSLKDNNNSHSYTFLENAYNNTLEFSNILKKTEGVLAGEYEEMLSEKSSKDILERLTDVYNEKITSNIIEPLQNDQNINRFRLEMTKILESVEDYDDDKYEVLLKSLMHNKKVKREEAEEKLSNVLIYINKTLDTIDTHVSNIVRQNTQYMNTTRNRYTFLRSGGDDAKAEFEKILRDIAKNVGNERENVIIGNFQNKAHITRMESLDEGSLYRPRKNVSRKPFDPQPLESKKENNNEDEIKQLIKSSFNQISKKDVFTFIHEKTTNNKTYTVDEGSTIDDKIFTILLLALNYRFEVRCPYVVEIEEEIVQVGKYELQKMKFRRKRK